jgi:hypothetical protein
MTGDPYIPAHLRRLTAAQRDTIRAAAAAAYTANPPPPLTPGLREALRVLLRRTQPRGDPEVAA